MVKTHQRDLETKAIAVYDKSEAYRYSLVIEWDDNLPGLMVIGLNPSTATERDNDPTIERLERSARRSGYGSLEMFNAYAFRSTDPKGLWKTPNPVGLQNDQYILANAMFCQTIVLAWGSNIQPRREYEIVQKIRDELGPVAWNRLHCWKITQNGHPGHPLYLKNDVLDFPVLLGPVWFENQMLKLVDYKPPRTND